jgi:hypothetical protein
MLNHWVKNHHPTLEKKKKKRKERKRHEKPKAKESR